MEALIQFNYIIVTIVLIQLLMLVIFHFESYGTKTYFFIMNVNRAIIVFWIIAFFVALYLIIEMYAPNSIIYGTK